MTEILIKESQPDNTGQFRDIRLLEIFNYYRIVVSVMLLATYFNEAGKAFIGLEYPTLFLSTAVAYTSINLTLVVLIKRGLEFHGQRLVINILIDIFALSLLTYANGGVNSGFGNLVIFSIAAGSIMVTGRYAGLFAAVASIAMLFIEVYRSTIDLSTPHYFQAGVLGMVYFATALFVRGISRRIYVSESLALQRASDIAHLEKLNQLIIQRMRTGIIVCNKQGKVHMMNQAAVRLLDSRKRQNASQLHMRHLPAPLILRLEQWLKNPQRRTAPFQTYPENPEVQANFTAFRQDENADVLVFLEDNTKATQQAQQLKLASLGQLTASIAHEIRNPLGAISHAAQLLDESSNLDDADRRLTHMVQNHSKRMNSTIENILELSRRRPPSPEALSLNSWLAEFILSFNESEEQPGKFTIEVNPEDLQVQVDASQLHQVLTNLAKNGLRYSKEKTGQSTLHFRAGVQPDTELPYLDIIDDGPGISKEALHHLFEPFYTTERSGTGLGLYISRELCEANHARLDHIASYPDGCCFRIIFPHPKQITDHD